MAPSSGFRCWRLDRAIAAGLAASCVASIFGATPAAGQGIVARRVTVPVREVTLFKDGYGFVVHEGVVAPDSAGRVVLDQLPNPVLGTFWPFSADSAVRLVSTIAGRNQDPGSARPAGLIELIEANIGAAVTIRLEGLAPLKGSLVGLQRRSGPEPQVGEMVMVHGADGFRIMPLARVIELQFEEEPRRDVPTVHERRQLTLGFEWRQGRAAAVRVGLGYLERGLWWAPSYQIEIDGKGSAVVTLQATISNDVTDLDRVPARLVIGAPTFSFRGRIDPIALQETLVQTETLRAGGSQVVGGYWGNAGFRAEADQSPADVPGERHEDLFVFTVPSVTLRKGERMAIPVARSVVKYRDLFALTIHHGTLAELQTSYNPEQSEQLRRLAKPTVMHRLRLDNTTGQPFTTAPALVVRQGQVLAQAMMTYTPAGGTVDLDLTEALDVQVEKRDEEVRRTKVALEWRGTSFARVDLAGSIELTNRRDVPVELEVTRYLLGHVDTATAGSRRSRVNVLEDGPHLPPAVASWWSWYSWPWWWSALNGLTRIEWTVRLAPGERRQLTVRSHYFWE